MNTNFPNTKQTQDIDLTALFSKEGRRSTEMEDELSGLSYDTSDEDEVNEENVDVDAQRKKRNRFIGNILIYSGIAIFVVLCIVTGVLLFMGQNGEPIKALRFEEQEVTVRAGHSVKLNVLTEPGNVEYAISYSVSDENIAEIGTDGTLKGIKAGEATVTAKSGNVSSECTVTVERDSISAFEISESELNMKTGDEKEIKLTCTPSDASDKNIEWKSSDDSVVKVSNGKLTAAGSGEAVVTVSDTVTGIKREIKVTVTDPEQAESISFNEESITLNVGDSYETELTYDPDTTEAKYSVFYTSDQTIASVDEYGMITANDVGECTITAVYYYDDSVTAELKVTVIDPLVLTTSPEETEPPETEPPETAPPVQQPSGGGIETINGITYVNGIMIANKTYSLPADYDPGVQDDAINAFYEMQAAAYEDGISLYIVSGYRSYDTQYYIYWDYVSSDGQAEADRYSARPGHSEHQTGYAFDLNSLDQSFGDTPEGIWLKENCYKYGFIIRYPKEKESVTGYMYEPWHVRYLGKDIATSVYNSGLCLEEYLGITSKYQE